MHWNSGFVWWKLNLSSHFWYFFRWKTLKISYCQWWSLENILINCPHWPLITWHSGAWLRLSFSATCAVKYKNLLQDHQSIYTSNVQKCVWLIKKQSVFTRMITLCLSLYFFGKNFPYFAFCMPKLSNKESYSCLIKSSNNLFCSCLLSYRNCPFHEYTYSNKV